MKVAHRAIAALIGWSLTYAVGAVGVAGADGPLGSTGTQSEPPAIQWFVIPNHPVLGPWLPAAPLVAIWPDGRVITLAPELIHPDPLVMPQLVGSVAPQVVDDLMERAERAGLLGEEIIEEPPIDQAPHAPLTTLMLRDGESLWSHNVYALRSDGSETGPRAALAGFIESLRGPLATDVGPYVPGAVTIRTRRQGAVAPGSTAAVVAWPSTGPPLTDDGQCVEVTDRATIAVLLDASVLTRFEADGVVWELAARPAVPGAPMTC